MTLYNAVFCMSATVHLASLVHKVKIFDTVHTILFYSCIKTQPVFTGTERKQVCVAIYGGDNFLVYHAPLFE